MMKTFFKWLTVVGITLALGFLSFAGMYLLHPTWFGISPLIWSLAAFGFAVVIEILVILQNVEQAFKKLTNSGEDYLKRAVTIAALDEFTQRTEAKELPPRLHLYKEIKNRLKQIDHLKDEFTPMDRILEYSAYKKLSEEEATLEQDFKDLEKGLIVHYGTIDKAPTIISADPAADKTNRDKILKKSIEQELKQRSSTKAIFFIKVFALFTGGSAFFATFEACRIGIAQLSSQFSFLASNIVSQAVCYPIAILAGIGYIFLTYNNLIQLVHERAFSTSTAAKQKNAFYYIARLVVLLLALYVTAALFWTWRSSGQVAIGQILPALGTLGGTATITVLAVGMVIPTLLWNITNAFKTLTLMNEAWKKGKFRAAFRQLLENISASWEKAKQAGAYYEFFNPFRLFENLINFFFRTSVLTAHCVSMGVTSDKLGPIPPIATAVVGSTSEVLTDIPYLHHEDEHDDSTSTANTTGAPSTTATSLTAPLLDKKPEQHPALELPEAEHNHFDLAGILLIPILTALKIARFLFDFTCSILASLFGILNKNWLTYARALPATTFSNSSLAEQTNITLAAIAPPLPSAQALAKSYSAIDPCLSSANEIPNMTEVTDGSLPCSLLH